VASDQGPFYRALGERLRKARVKKNIKQGELARAVGLARTSITNIECGRQPVEVRVLVQIATTLGTSVTRLIPRSERSSEELPRKAQRLNSSTQAWVRRVIGAGKGGGGEDEHHGTKVFSRTTEGS
jgi:transcriptional regulator with XRE-family HTH domain